MANYCRAVTKSFAAHCLSLSFYYLSLISERPEVCCPSLPLSPYFQRDSMTYEPCHCISPSVICLLFKRNPAAAASPLCLCLPPSIIVILFQRDPAPAAPSLPLLLLSGSYFRETLWLLLLYASVSIIVLFIKRDSVTTALYSLSLSPCFSYLSLVSERPCGCCFLRALSQSLSPSVICRLFQRDPVAPAPSFVSLLPSYVSYIKETL